MSSTINPPRPATNSNSGLPPEYLYFMRRLGHELRNPLTALCGAIELINSGRCSPQAQTQMIAMLARQASELTHVVDRLQEVSSTSRDDIAQVRERVDMAVIVRGLVKKLPTPSRFKLSLRDEVWIDADPQQLVQTITSLIDNAVEHSDPDSEIEIVLDHGMGQSQLIVCDHGQGIDPSRVQAVETSAGTSHWVSPSEMPKAGGLAASLLVCRHVLESADATIRLASDGEGTGTAVTIAWPTIEVNQTELDHGPARPRESAAKRVGRCGGRAVVIDDVQQNALVASRLIQALGYDVATFHSASQALGYIRHVLPDVVVTDLSMPGTSGVELARLLRGDAGTRLIGLVAMSGEIDGIPEGDRTLFDAKVAKPVSIASLSEVLHVAE